MKNVLCDGDLNYLKGLINSLQVGADKIKPGELHAEEHYLHSKAKALVNFLNEEEPKDPNAWKNCPACKVNELNPEPVMNSRSRFTDCYICSDCGTREALEGYFWK